MAFGIGGGVGISEISLFSACSFNVRMVSLTAALCSESEFVSDVTHRYELSLRRSIRVAPLSDLRLLLASAVLQISALISFDSVASRVRVLVAAVRRDIVFEGSDGNEISILLEVLLLECWLLRFIVLLVVRLLLIVVAEAV